MPDGLGISSHPVDPCGKILLDGVKNLLERIVYNRFDSNGFPIISNRFPGRNFYNLSEHQLLFNITDFSYKNLRVDHLMYCHLLHTILLMYCYVLLAYY